MRHKKLIIVAVVLCAAIGGLIVVAMGSSLDHYETIGQLWAKGDEAYGQSVKVRGHLFDNPTYDSATDTYTFDLFDINSEGEVLPVAALPVVYQGQLPQQLRGEIERMGVTAEGELQPDNTFHANKLMVSCPSKYESK